MMEGARHANGRVYGRARLVGVAGAGMGTAVHAQPPGVRGQRIWIR